MPHSRLALAVMAKAPIAGAAKTRLQPAFSAAQAGCLAAAFLRDTLRNAALSRAADLHLCFTPASARAEFRKIAGDGVPLFAQHGDGLSERIANAFRHLFDRGYAGALLMNADTPDLPGAFLRAAAERLLKADNRLVLGPAEDGGYYLVGVNAVSAPLLDHLFGGIHWSSPAVLRETVERAVPLGLDPHLLPFWYDVDTPADVARLWQKLQIEAGDSPASLACLKEIFG